MSGNSQLLQQWPLLRLLSARRTGVSFCKMAQEPGLSDKTIDRDLHVFPQIGFPVEETVGLHGRKTGRLKALPYGPPMSFTYDEAMALYLDGRFGSVLQEMHRQAVGGWLVTDARARTSSPRGRGRSVAFVATAGALRGKASQTAPQFAADKSARRGTRPNRGGRVVYRVRRFENRN